jgi:hypothetical protein
MCSAAPTAPPARESCCAKVSLTRPARRLNRDTPYFAPSQAQEAAPGCECTGYARGESSRSVTRGKMRIAEPCSLYSPLLSRVVLHQSTPSCRRSHWRPSNGWIADAPNRAAEFNLGADKCTSPGRKQSPSTGLARGSPLQLSGVSHSIIFDRKVCCFS